MELSLSHLQKPTKPEVLFRRKGPKGRNTGKASGLIKSSRGKLKKYSEVAFCPSIIQREKNVARHQVPARKQVHKCERTNATGKPAPTSLTADRPPTRRVAHTLLQTRANTLIPTGCWRSPRRWPALQEAPSEERGPERPGPTCRPLLAPTAPGAPGSPLAACCRPARPLGRLTPHLRPLPRPGAQASHAAHTQRPPMPRRGHAGAFPVLPGLAGSRPSSDGPAAGSTATGPSYGPGPTPTARPAGWFSSVPCPQRPTHFLPTAPHQSYPFPTLVTVPSPHPSSDCAPPLSPWGSEQPPEMSIFVHSCGHLGPGLLQSFTPKWQPNPMGHPERKVISGKPDGVQTAWSPAGRNTPWHSSGFDA